MNSSTSSRVNVDADMRVYGAKGPTITDSAIYTSGSNIGVSFFILPNSLTGDLITKGTTVLSVSELSLRIGQRDFISINSNGDWWKNAVKQSTTLSKEWAVAGNILIGQNNSPDFTISHLTFFNTNLSEKQITYTYFQGGIYATDLHKYIIAPYPLQSAYYDGLNNVTPDVVEQYNYDKTNYIEVIGSSAWNSGFVLSDSLVNEFYYTDELTATNQDRVVGITNTLTPASYDPSNISIGLYITTSNMMYYALSGVYTYLGIIASVGDVFKFEQNGSDVDLLRNDIVVYTFSSVTLSGNYVMASVYDSCDMRNITVDGVNNITISQSSNVTNKNLNGVYTGNHAVLTNYTDSELGISSNSVRESIFDFYDKTPINDRINNLKSDSVNGVALKIVKNPDLVADLTKSMVWEFTHYAKIDAVMMSACLWSNYDSLIDRGIYIVTGDDMSANCPLIIIHIHDGVGNFTFNTFQRTDISRTQFYQSINNIEVDYNPTGSYDDFTVTVNNIEWPLKVNGGTGTITTTIYDNNSTYSAGINNNSINTRVPNIANDGKFLQTDGYVKAKYTLDGSVIMDIRQDQDAVVDVSGTGCVGTIEKYGTGDSIILDAYSMFPLRKKALLLDGVDQYLFIPSGFLPTSEKGYTVIYGLRKPDGEDYRGTLDVLSSNRDGDFFLNYAGSPPGITSFVPQRFGSEIQSTRGYFEKASVDSWHTIASYAKETLVDGDPYVFVNVDYIAYSNDPNTKGNDMPYGFDSLNGELYIGRDDGIASFFKGYVSYFSIWKGRLSPKEIIEIHNNTLFKNPSDKLQKKYGLELFVDFNNPFDDAGTLKFPDLSPNGHTIEAISSTWTNLTTLENSLEDINNLR